MLHLQPLQRAELASLGPIDDRKRVEALRMLVEAVAPDPEAAGGPPGSAAGCPGLRPPILFGLLMATISMLQHTIHS